MDGGVPDKDGLKESLGNIGRFARASTFIVGLGCLKINASEACLIANVLKGTFRLRSFPHEWMRENSSPAMLSHHCV